MACKTHSHAFEAKTASLHDVMEFVRAGAREANLPEERIGELDLVIEEIFVNVCRHAYPEGAKGMARVTYWVAAPGELKVEIADQGAEFDPLQAPPADVSLDLEDRPIGGLGIFLVTALADSLSYRREDGWNRLSFHMSSDE